MKRLFTLAAALLLYCTISLAAEKPIPAFAPMCDSLTAYLRHTANLEKKLYVCGASVSGGKLNLIFSFALSEYPLRDSTVARIYDIVDDNLPAKYKEYRGKTTIRTNGQKIEDLSSKYYKSNRSNSYVKDHARLVGVPHANIPAPLVKDLSRAYPVSKGLENRHIALWQSHGYYYESSLKRWEWQRGRLMQTVEDLYTQGYVLPFLVPMLENAGANVLLPRERDWNTDEVISDYDMAGSGYAESGFWSDAQGEGFCDKGGEYIDGENPFTMGGVRMTSGAGDDGRECTASWTPDFPRTGRYAVYVSYKTLSNSTTAARYEVRHSGGSSFFSVNQKMGGSTWIYLGTFLFDGGACAGQGVYLTNSASGSRTVVTADAVRFGGGKGNIARSPLNPDFAVKPETSGYPRAAEAARYWLQWAGFNDSIYSPTKFEKDYNDDYQCRGKWVNALSNGSYVNPKENGYNIPIDLSFAFHSDAGIADRDSTIGTLAIYTRVARGKELYANGEKRAIARDYADIVQTQIVSDIRASYDPKWSRRALRDKSYSESSTQEVPAMLLEFLSHQNFTDMRFGLDPGFRFVVSRAIYKGMLKYLAYLNGTDFVVQPLPVNSFSVALSESQSGGKFAELRWKPTVDTLEETAAPTGYIVYTRRGDGGFDNGTVTQECSFSVEIDDGEIYGFKIAAFNEGGVSFPSEVLSVGTVKGESQGKVLVVNNFDRVSAPSWFSAGDSTYAGFRNFIDGGVPYFEDITFCGDQFDYRCRSSWKDDDNAGFGASYGNYETMVIAGNTFDFPAVHGKALLAAGYDFCSSSAAAYAAGDADTTSISALDVICGKQVTTSTGYKGAGKLRYPVFPAALRDRISAYAAAGGNILISGANIASDLWDPVFDYDIDSTMRADIISPGRKFATDILKYKWRSNMATATGSVTSVQNPIKLEPGVKYEFHIKPNTERYHVESPDAIEPADKSGAYTIFRYSDNNISAGVAYMGTDYRVVSLGFPVETLTTQEQIDDLMAGIMKLFK